jgi:hypothetical protein
MGLSYCMVMTTPTDCPHCLLDKEATHSAKNSWSITMVHAINPRHGKLITALRTAVEDGDDVPDKEAISHNDVFDTIGLSLIPWHRQR